MIKTILAITLMATINTNNTNNEGMYAKIKTTKRRYFNSIRI